MPKIHRVSRKFRFQSALPQCVAAMGMAVLLSPFAALNARESVQAEWGGGSHPIRDTSPTGWDGRVPNQAGDTGKILVPGSRVLVSGLPAEESWLGTLILGQGTELVVGELRSTGTWTDVRLDGGMIHCLQPTENLTFANSESCITIGPAGGFLSMSGKPTRGRLPFRFNINARFAGPGNLMIQERGAPDGTIGITGDIALEGDIVVGAGRLWLVSGTMTFLLRSEGECNQIRGEGGDSRVLMDRPIILNTDHVKNEDEGKWQLIDVASLGEGVAYGKGFSLAGFVTEGGRRGIRVWIKQVDNRTFSFVESSGKLFLGSVIETGAETRRIRHGSTELELAFTPIDNPHNQPDSTGFGYTRHRFFMGIQEITIGQFKAALAADPGIRAENKVFPWSEEHGSLMPVTDVSWLEAARFANWLTSGNALKGAYQFGAAGQLKAIDRAAALEVYGDVYVLPTESEWYKAAYFDGSKYWIFSLPHGVLPQKEGHPGRAWFMDKHPQSVPYSSVEMNGTRDMMGNVAEWTESPWSASDGLDGPRAVRGGSWQSLRAELSSRLRKKEDIKGGSNTIGFRVALLQHK